MFRNLLDYGNKYIEKFPVDEDKARNSLLLIDLSINEKILPGFTILICAKAIPYLYATTMFDFKATYLSKFKFPLII